jgi:hypothetical protein
MRHKIWQSSLFSAWQMSGARVQRELHAVRAFAQIDGAIAYCEGFGLSVAARGGLTIDNYGRHCYPVVTGNDKGSFGFGWRWPSLPDGHDKPTVLGDPDVGCPKRARQLDDLSEEWHEISLSGLP